MFQKYILLVILISCWTQKAIAQKEEIDTVNGDVVFGKKIVRNKKFYGTPKLVALNVSKYIDTLKKIHIYYGSNSLGVRVSQLRESEAFLE